ncbi:MAG: hypothetical protein ABIH18_05255 [Candidatus Omnitrophota bacterium]
MVAFFLVIIVAAAALAIFALMPSKESIHNEKKQESESLNSHFVRSELTLKMEEQINSLNLELERLKTEREQVRNELSLANDLVSNLKDELVRIRKNDKTVEYGELEKLRNDNIHLRDDLYKKGQELEKSLSDNLSLSKDLSKNQGAAAKLELLEKQIADYNNKIEEYKALINKLEESTKEAVPKQEYNQINNKCIQLSGELEAFKNKSIPKEEYEALTRKVAEAESKIGNFNNENQDLVNKIKILENEINEHNKEILQQREIIREHEQSREHAVEETKKLEIFKQEKSDLENKIKMLESQINEYSKEIEKHNEIISQRQNQEKQIDAAFKKEYDDLKSRLEVSESQMKELAKLTKENIDLLEQVKSLEKQIENYNKESKKDEAIRGVSKEQYEELKQKLEKAEEVLRIVHGAGS